MLTDRERNLIRKALSHLYMNSSNLSDADAQLALDLSKRIRNGEF